MKYSTESLKKVEEILNNCEIEIKSILLSLNNSFSRFTSSFNKLFTNLNSQQIINIDPYGQDNKLESLELPSQSEILTNEEAYEMSIRLTHYSVLLNYIKDNDRISIEKLTPDTFSKLKSIVQYMEWEQIFDLQPTEHTTCALSQLLFQYEKSTSQPLIISALKSLVSDISRYSKKIIEELEPVEFYISEIYKLYIRSEILDSIKLPSQLAGENIKKAHDLISAKVKEHDIPVFIELIGEILKEDFTIEGEKERNEVVKRLQYLAQGETDIPEEVIVEEKVDPMDIIRNILIELGKIESQTETIINKLKQNNEANAEENSSPIQKFIDFILYNLLKKERVTIYSISLKNEDGTQKIKDLEFEKFLSKLKKYDEMILNLKNFDSSESAELFEKESEDIKNYIHKLISKSRYYYRNLTSLDEYFKKNLNTPKGIQVELKVYLSALDRAQELYYEYTTLLEDENKSSTYKPCTDQVI